MHHVHAGCRRKTEQAHQQDRGDQAHQHHGDRRIIFLRAAEILHRIRDRRNTRERHQAGGKRTRQKQHQRQALQRMGLQLRGNHIGRRFSQRQRTRGGTNPTHNEGDPQQRQENVQRPVRNLSQQLHATQRKQRQSNNEQHRNEGAPILNLGVQRHQKRGRRRHRHRHREHIVHQRGCTHHDRGQRTQFAVHQLNIALGSNLVDVVPVRANHQQTNHRHTQTNPG